MKQAGRDGHDVVILDTAGRLTIDDVLMKSLRTSENSISRQHTAVCDAMVGQDAVTTASPLTMNLTFLVSLAKMDGDTRGGAALSIKEITGKNIKFLGMGEDIEQLDDSVLKALLLASWEWERCRWTWKFRT